MPAALVACSDRDVVALAPDAEDHAFIPQRRQRMRGSAMRDTVLLRKAEDRWHPAGQIPGLDLAAQQFGELLMQRDWRIVVQHGTEPTSPVGARARRGLPECTRVYTSRMSDDSGTPEVELDVRVTLQGAEQSASALRDEDAAADAQLAGSTEAHERRLPREMALRALL